jgi:cytochrome o ubiquinol oxidase operon protein cyoD
MAKTKAEMSTGKLSAYILGYLLSLELTLVAYGIVNRAAKTHLSFGYRKAVISVVVLAIMQLFVQLVCFLHLDRESKPRWNLKVLLFAALIVLIVVFGSLWIMNNLNYHMEQPGQVNKYLRSQGDL